MSTSPPRPAAVIDYDAEYDRHVKPAAGKNAWWNKGKAKMKQNPMVPIATAATCYALWGAVQANKKQDRVKLQKMFRYRLIAQGVAIASIVLGGIFFEGRTPLRDMGKLPDEISRGTAIISDKLLNDGANTPAPVLPPRAAPPLLTAPDRSAPASPSLRGASSSSPPITSVVSELSPDVDWKNPDDASARSAARKELRRRQVEGFLARKETGDGNGEGRRAGGA